MPPRKSNASFGGHGVVVCIPEGSEALERAHATMKKGATLFEDLELCTTWPPHVTVVAGPWLSEEAARACASHVSTLLAPFMVTLGPRVQVDGEVEDRAAIYSADQTLRAGWVEATPLSDFMELHRSAMAFVGKEAHAFEPHASLHYFESDELDPSQKAKMLDGLRAAWGNEPLSFLAAGVHVTRYVGTTPDEWKAIGFYPFQGRASASEDSKK